MKKKISIEGMSCGHCVNHAREALSELNGVINVNINLEEKYAILESDIDIKDEDIKFAIDDVGYEVIKIETL